MGFRFRKRISLGKFARLNLSRSGVSLGLGPRGMNVNLSSRGMRTTVGVPGTGLFWQEQRAWRKGSPGRRTVAGGTILLIFFALLGSRMCNERASDVSHPAPTPTPAIGARSETPTVAAAPPAETTPRPGDVTAAPPISDDVPLSRDAVAEIQRALARLGFDPGPIDGIVGAKTRAAIKAYQAARDLEPSGFISVDLAARVLREDAQANR